MVVVIVVALGCHDATTICLSNCYELHFEESMVFDEKITNNVKQATPSE